MQSIALYMSDPHAHMASHMCDMQYICILKEQLRYI